MADIRLIQISCTPCDKYLVMVLSFLVCQLGLILFHLFKEKLSHFQNDNTATDASTT